MALTPLSQLSHPRELVRQFTPNWFTINMGTGILYLMLAQFPYPIPGLDTVAETLWWVNIGLFALFSLLFIGRCVFFTQGAHALLRHPVQSMFLGAIPMALATLINGLLAFGVAHWGDRAIAIAQVLWWVDAGLAAGIGWLVPYYMFTVHEHSVEHMTPVWLLPIVAAEVAAASGGLLAPHLGANAGAVLYVSYALWALSVPLAMGVLVILFLRLTLHKLPPRDMAVSSWLALGLIGTGALGLLVLGQAAPKALDGSAMAVMTTGAVQFGLLGGLLLWGYGLWWLVMACLITLRYLREGLPFNMGWWGFTFPLGVYCAATLELARLTQFAPFTILGAALVVALLGFWLLVFTRTCHGAWHGYLIHAPCLDAKTRLNAVACQIKESNAVPRLT